jgi:hypothetical protein
MTGKESMKKAPYDRNTPAVRRTENGSAVQDPDEGKHPIEQAGSLAAG